MSIESSASRLAGVESIEGIVARLYETISGAAGEARDWDGYRALVLPGARMIPTNRAIHDGQGGHPPDVMDPETFIRTSAPLVEAMDFHERQIAMRVERFGCIAHVWSTYESMRSPDDAEPFARGINSIQLYHDGARWWVVNVFWDSERADNPIPPQYLPGSTGIVTLELDRASRASGQRRACRGCGVARHDADATFCKHCGTAL